MPKPPASPQPAPTIAAPHPLTVRLIERLAPPALVLDFASGSGRNTAALNQAGFTVVALDDRTAATPVPFAGITGRFAAALSTHGLLHGNVAAVAQRVTDIAALLEKNGLLYATFGSVRDARFGVGERLDEFTFAPSEGDERGVPHAFFDRERLAELLEQDYAIESLEEHAVDEVVGSWAHRQAPLAGAAHWFAIAKVR
ncbi:MAG: hypothetical protein WAK16_05190 [Candidatus Cybelea sp.]